MTKHLANWVNHVKKCAQDHDLKYGQALKNADCRQAYKNGSSSEVEVSEVNITHWGHTMTQCTPDLSES
jgi:hypothetical protein